MLQTYTILYIHTKRQTLHSPYTRMRDLITDLILTHVPPSRSNLVKIKVSTYFTTICAVSSPNVVINCR